jgi:hypothetical protein
MVAREKDLRRTVVVKAQMKTMKTMTMTHCDALSNEACRARGRIPH